MLIAALTIFIIAGVILLVWAWVSSIDFMNENHPDYKGEDFLNWGSDASWEMDYEDDNHTERDTVV
jgi:hypothetical protein